MIKFCFVIFIYFFSYSQHIYFEYGYTAPHSPKNESLGYGNEDSFLGLTYQYKFQNQTLRTSFHSENWSYTKDDAFGTFKRTFSYYSISQTIAVYEGIISVFPGVEFNFLNDSKLSASTSYGSIKSKIKSPNKFVSSVVLDLIYYKNKFTLFSGVRANFNELVKDRKSSSIQVQFGLGYKF